jgi:hypothetical protein
MYSKMIKLLLKAGFIKLVSRAFLYFHLFKHGKTTKLLFDAKII